jgi:hypothetical protein
MKTLRTAAMVVGGVALVATGVGAIGGLVLGAKVIAVAGVSMGTWTAIGAAAGVVGALSAKKPKVDSTGSQTQFTADPSSGIPYAIGTTGIAGKIVHQGAFGKDNKYQSFVIDWSGGGPIQSFDQFSVDRVPVNFAGGAAVGEFQNWMWLTTGAGAMPQASALSPPFPGLPGWGAASKISGHAHGIWTLAFDPKGKKFANGVPKPMMVGKWSKVYDPRQDSTFPGGSGPCRALDESTYVWAGPGDMPAGENPWLNALTWALGRWHNGKRVLGVGIPVAGIDVGAYVEAANIADVNGWKTGGMVQSTDDKWAVMKAMCQAGGGEPMRLGAKLSCFVNTPRVSLATITADDLADGDISITAMQPRRNRINGVVPRFRSAEHDWEIVSGDPVRVGAYVTQDGGERTREIEFPLVQDKSQAAQLAMYEVVNAREFGPINMPLKPFWIGYKPGDCLTVDMAETGLDGQDVIVLGRNFDPATGVVTPSFRSETSAKHALALGKAGVAPPTPSLSTPLVSPPEHGAVLAVLIANSFTAPTRVLSAAESGGFGSITVANHDRVYSDGLTIDIPGATIAGLLTDTVYMVYYDDIGRTGEAITFVATTDTAEAQAGAGRHSLGRIRTPINASGVVREGGGVYPTGSTLGGEIKRRMPTGNEVEQ